MDPYSIYKNQLSIRKARIGNWPAGDFLDIDNQGNMISKGDITLSGGARIKGQIDLLNVGLKGTVVIDTFPFNTVTLTEAAAAFAKVSDGGVFLNLAVSGGGGGYTANYQIWPDTELENDACYFGATAKFGALYFDISATVATYGADSAVWEYWNGTAWTTLTIIWDHTDADDGDGDRPFQQDGYLIFSAPTDWAANIIDSQSAYWIRSRIISGFDVTQIPLTDSKEHQIPSNANASEIPYAVTISRCRFNWDTVSTGTADTKLIFYNFTTNYAKELTITKALRDFAIADVAITVAANDEFGWYVSQVDGGGTEYADGSVEMKVTRT